MNPNEILKGILKGAFEGDVTERVKDNLTDCLNPNAKELQKRNLKEMLMKFKRNAERELKGKQ